MSRTGRPTPPTPSSEPERAPERVAPRAAGSLLFFAEDGADGDVDGWTFCGWPDAEGVLKHPWDVVALAPEYVPAMDSDRSPGSSVLLSLRNFVEAGGTLVALLPPRSTDDRYRTAVLGVLGRLIDSRVYDLSGAAGDVGGLRGYRWTVRQRARPRKKSARPDLIQVVPVGPRDEHVTPVAAYTGMKWWIELVVGSHYWTRGQGCVVLLPTWRRPLDPLLEIAATVPALDLDGRAVGEVAPQLRDAAWKFARNGKDFLVVIPEFGDVKLQGDSWAILRRLHDDGGCLVRGEDLVAAMMPFSGQGIDDPEQGVADNVLGKPLERLRTAFKPHLARIGLPRYATFQWLAEVRDEGVRGYVLRRDLFPGRRFAVAPRRPGDSARPKDLTARKP